MPNSTPNNLHRYWYIVAREKDVRRKPQSVTLFNEHYVVFANEHGSYSALQDRCPHRNAPLSAGKVCNGHIQCPYHGWQFDGDGKLQNIPALPSTSLPALKIPSVLCLAQDGYIWLCLDKPKYSSPLKFPYLNKQGVNERGWTSFRLHTVFNAPVEQCLENFLDCPHAVYVHDSWFRAPTGKPVKAVLRQLDEGAEVQYYDEPREKSWVWRLLQNSDTQMSHTDRFIAPATSQVEYRFSDKKRYIITSSCTPRTDNTTHVYTVISFRYGLLSPLIRLVFEPLSRLIIKQDVAIMHKQRNNINRFGAQERFYHSKADLLLPLILSWRQALQDNETPPIAGVKSEHILQL